MARQGKYSPDDKEPQSPAPSDIIDNLNSHTRSAAKLDPRIHACKVRDLIGSGISEQDTAKYVNMSLSDFRRDYKDIIDTAIVDRTVEVSKALYAACLLGNVTAMQFWLKNVGKWESIFKDDGQEELEDSSIKEIQISLLTADNKE